jgi:hypothetical protein
MHRPPPASFLARLLQPPAPVELDAADFGTAFGLDMSVPPDDQAAGTAVDRTQPGWLQRLGLI